MHVSAEEELEQFAGERHANRGHSRTIGPEDQEKSDGAGYKRMWRRS